jgi:hydrogenase small subunit
MGEPVAGTTFHHPNTLEVHPRLKELDVLWITAGLGCDGDTIAMTAATQPSIEDLVLGAFPGSLLSSNAVMTYGKGIHALRKFTMASPNKEPKWRRGKQE